MYLKERVGISAEVGRGSPIDLGPSKAVGGVVTTSESPMVNYALHELKVNSKVLLLSIGGYCPAHVTF